MSTTAGMRKRKKTPSRNRVRKAKVYPPASSFRPPQRPSPTRFVFYIATPELKTLAQGYIDALVWFDEIADEIGAFSHEMTLAYRDSTQARRVERTKIHLRSQHIGQPTPSRNAQWIRRHGRNLRGRIVEMDVHEFLARHRDLENTARLLISSADNDSSRHPWKVLTLATDYRRLLFENRPSGFDLGDWSLSDQAPANLRMELASRQQAVLHFLEALADSYHKTKPRLPADQPVHYTVEISRDCEVKCNGKDLKLNEARKAALFVLALLGTTGVSIEDFARHYRTVLTNQEDTHHYANTFRNALTGLRRSLPKIEFQPATEEHHRDVFGLRFANPPRPAITRWLRDYRRD